jgi:xanthine dehydrogenase accessory factor
VHISQALVQIARAVGYSIEIIDPRTAFATPERFPDVRLHAEWPEDYLKNHPLDAYTAMVAVTHDPKIDDTALIEALKANCLYVGALGSRKTHGKRVERLVAADVSAADIERIASPIGLDIGAASPGEIAVAIMAQIIEVLRHRDGV